jgi:hypothetical protein
MGERKCLYCGGDVSALRDDARYCSGAHRQAAYRERQKRRDQAQPWRVTGAVHSTETPGRVL